MAIGRIRTRSTDGPTGSLTVNVGTPSEQTFWNPDNLSMSQTTEDTLGGRNTVNVFDSSGFRWKERAALNGMEPTGSFRARFSGYIPSGVVPPPPGHLSILGIPSNADAVQQVAAQTNPGNVHVNLPLAAFELKDLPMMLKSAGDVLQTIDRLRSSPARLARYLRSRQGVADAASNYLGYEFGWAPLISDIRRFIGLTHAMDTRVQTLNSMVKNGGLKRRRTVFTAVASDSSNVTIQSSQATVRARRTRVTKVTKWVTMRWVPTNVPQIRALAADRHAMDRMLTGTSGSGHDIGSTLWNAIPWTWAFDWAVGMNNAIRANNNSVPVQCKNIAVMTRTESKGDYSVTEKPDWLQGGHASYERWTRFRTPGGLSVLPVGRLPFMSGDQFSILAAIRAARR